MIDTPSRAVDKQTVQSVSVVEYGARRLILVIGVMMAALLQTLDATIVNVALPTIEGNIGASIDDGIWIVTGYIISNVIAIPLAPFLIARLGRRKYYAACIIGFTVASFLCGTATSLPTLVLFRVIQGAFGGGLIATSQIILRDTLPLSKVGTSAAIFAIALTAGPALGPTLGGWLTDNLSWPWVFDINIVPGAIAATIVLIMLREPVKAIRLSFDYVGLGLLALALGSMQFVLDEGERNDWFSDSGMVTFALTCVAGFAGFIWWELYGTRTPIVDLRVFTFGNVAVGACTGLLLGMIVFGPTVVMPQYVQGVLGFTATMSGGLMLLRALPVILLTPIIARLATRIDARVLLVSGFAISALSFIWMSRQMTPLSDFGSFAPVMLFSGLGQSMLLVPLLVAMLGTVPPAMVPKASSFTSLSVQLGGSISSTMLITIFDQRTYFHADILRSSVNMGSVILHRGIDQTRALTVLASLVRQQATNLGFADAIAVLVPVAAVAIGIALLLKRGKAPVPASALAAE